MTAFVRVARSLDVLLKQLNTAAPRRSKVSDGALGDVAHALRTSDHNPNGAGIVTARDYTHDPAGGLDCQRLAEQLVASGDRRIKYVIWNRRIWTPASGWQPYSGSNAHTKHLHLSVKGSAALYDDTSPWQVGARPPAPAVEHPTPPPPPPGGPLMALTDAEQAQLFKRVNDLAAAVDWWVVADPGPNSKGELSRRIRDMHGDTVAIRSLVVALASRAPDVSIDAAAIAAAIPAEFAQQVVDELQQRLAT